MIARDIQGTCPTRSRDTPNIIRTIAPHVVAMSEFGCEGKVCNRGNRIQPAR
ncbi:MAG: hypothetical protein QOF73_3836 [Thermomicrobiales bacterium]|jgi:hypothetical protein|nr:hypothetical protein [Thermomicrobiales bacterium]